MNNTLKLYTIVFSILGLILFGLSGCNFDSPEHQANAMQKTLDEHEGHGHAEEAKDEHAGQDGHAEHNLGAADDMDESVEELFAASCEHNMKTYKCEECRYEVGVAKVPQDLIKQKLVEVQKVAERNFNSGITLTGEVHFDERKIAHISPRIPGIVSKVLVDLGQTVKAGQVLIELESVELAESQADYLEALAQKRLAKKSESRQKTLHEQKITSEKEYLQAQQVYESSKIRANSLRQKLMRYGATKAEVSKLEKQGLSYATGKLAVSAPFSGDILQLHTVRGEGVEPGSEMLLIGDTSSLWVWVDLFESQLASVRKAMQADGLPVSLMVRAYDNEMFSGKLDFVGKVMDKNLRIVKARVTLNNIEGKLKPGMFARVYLGLDKSQNKPSVPETAVVYDEDRQFVFVHQMDDYFVRRAVKTGSNVDGFIEILDGLTANQTVVVTGAFLLKSDVLRSKMGEGCAH